MLFDDWDADNSSEDKLSMSHYNNFHAYLTKNPELKINKINMLSDKIIQNFSFQDMYASISDIYEKYKLEVI
jgi:hypothetical protein